MITDDIVEYCSHYRNYFLRQRPTRATLTQCIPLIYSIITIRYPHLLGFAKLNEKKNTVAGAGPWKANNIDKCVCADRSEWSMFNVHHVITFILCIIDAVALQLCCFSWSRWKWAWKRMQHTHTHHIVEIIIPIHDHHITNWFDEIQSPQSHFNHSHSRWQCDGFYAIFACTKTHNALTGARAATARIKLCITYTFYSKNAVASTRQLLANNKPTLIACAAIRKMHGTIRNTHSAALNCIFYCETLNKCIICAGFSFSIIIIEWRWRTSTSWLNCGRDRIASEWFVHSNFVACVVARTLMPRRFENNK